MKRLIAVAFVFLAPAAVAQQTCPPTTPVSGSEALVCWTNATQDVNGNTLPATGPGAITQTRVQRAVVGSTLSCSFTTIAETLNVASTVTMLLFQNLGTGKQCFRARHIALDAAGLELLSDWSATASKVTTAAIGKAKPITITVY